MIKEKVSRIAFGAEIQITAILPKGDSGKRPHELLGPVAAAYRHYDNPAGARFRVGKVRRAIPGISTSPTICCDATTST